MNAAIRKLAKGALEVKALVESRRGIGEYHIPAGTIGYVQGAVDDTRMVIWDMPRQYSGDNLMSVHLAHELTPTGRRG